MSNQIGDRKPSDVYEGEFSERVVWDAFDHCRQIKLIRWFGFRKGLFVFVDCKADREHKVHSSGSILQISSFEYQVEDIKMLV